MLRFTSGHSYKNCTGFSRRSFLCAGASGIAGLTLPGLLAAEANSGAAQKRSVIIIHLDGGPPQMDLIDPKPNAPIDLRSPFAPIRTVVPGIHLTELMPNCARVADKLVLLRSLVGSDGKHHAFQCQSGYKETDLQAIGGRPALGCVVNQVLGSPRDEVPNFVDLMQGRPLVRDSARPGFLGPAAKPFRPDLSDRWNRELEEGMKGELARLGGNHKTTLKMISDIPVVRLDDRLALLKNIDQFSRIVDNSGSMAAMDQFTQQAYAILTSGAFAAAMDIDREDPRVIKHYTPDMKLEGKQSFTSEGPDAVLKFLLARRLVEAGVRVVSLSLSDFDTHRDNNERMQHLGPLFDFALSALITDLASRGMLEHVTVLAWGEFGRTPKVNNDGGRDHWPNLSMGLIAGGGIAGGFTLGASDRVGGHVTNRPITFADIVATLYQHLGIDPQSMIHDRTGRPHMLIDQGMAVSELV
ncbi:MAG: DUF1501 domain-containing protein [Pirellulaceae bacterium]